MIAENEFLENEITEVVETPESIVVPESASAEPQEEYLEAPDLAAIAKRDLPVLKKERSAEAAVDEKKWFSLRVISGKEKKIKERLEKEIENEGWKEIVFQVVVPTEKVFKMKNGKKVMQERNLLPGYILVEAYGSKLNGEVAKAINDAPNVIHFLGKEQPIPMSNVEAKRLLGIVDDSSESGASLVEPFLVGEPVKIIDGPFAEFIGDIQKIDDEKKKLTVIVKIFGRGTEMELNYMQVEKIS